MAFEVLCSSYAAFDLSNKTETQTVLTYLQVREDAMCLFGFKDAKETMDANIRRAILRDYSYDVVDYLKVTTTHEKVTYKYVLLPVWFGTLEYLQKKYRFVINGESGKLSGKFPVSILKVLILIFGIIILAIIMLILVGEFGV